METYLPPFVIVSQALVVYFQLLERVVCFHLLEPVICLHPLKTVRPDDKFVLGAGAASLVVRERRSLD
jgi:hypothetical protein